MCGIAGIYSVATSREIDHVTLKEMCDSINHRGPDDEGVFIDQECFVGLGHRRLSIIDLSTGGQPMCDAEQALWIVFNGEIYNYRELKDELKKRGYQFKTTSDTEVIIHLYKEYGVSAFGKLNGIFALAIFDRTSRTLILARDHFGIKPLYYTLQQGDLIFGSEIKTILKSKRYQRELDFESLNTFLTFRYNPSPQTLFKDVKKLSPGCYLKFDEKGSVELKPFYNSIPQTNLAITEQDALIQYQDLLEKAVSRQMVSDVPVGLLLSGGVDSAAIAYLMSSSYSKQIKTFSIGFEGEGDYNELSDARKTALLIGSEHFEATITQKEYLDFFYKSFHYSEEPIAEMTIPALYYVSKLASEHVKVVLAGQGADEPLAGYKRYFGEQKIERYFKLLNVLPLEFITRFLPRNERLKRAAYASKFQNELDRFLAIYTIFTPPQKSNLIKRDVLPLFRDTNLSLIQNLYSNTDLLSDSLSKILYIDTRMSLSDNLLLFGDKMSMANSIEMRVPFLDVDLVNFLETLPSSLKLKKNTHKYIHKMALKKWLPDEIIYRKKRGFSTPMDEWLQKDFSAVARDLFNDSNSASRKYFNLDYINSMLTKHQSRKENYQRCIFALLSFEIWHKSFFEVQYK
ncbi:MAG: asparagine synthase (glutamine-hydrolyzing) [Cyclobacteriaceae bacterium]|nr:asparagine synthase (glutamine-hydrolyzing) [Cyclobacteriaceae bacterium]